jgi:hypothetical protein
VFNIVQTKADIETIKQEIRYAQQEQASYQEMELLYNALEELQINLYKATKDNK